MADLLAETLTDADYAARRVPARTYVSKSFPLMLGASPDHGQPARYIKKVFDEPGSDVEAEVELEWTGDTVHESPGGRTQVTLQVARAAGQVRKMRLERVVTTAAGSKLDLLVEFDRTDSARLINLVRQLGDIPIEGPRTVYFDDDELRDLSENPEVLAELYRRDPVKFRRVIESQVTAEDVIAVEYRRAQVEEFRLLLNDPDHFAAADAAAGGPEKAWQRFLEKNPWILGVGLAGQLLTSWDPSKLERAVVGASVTGGGKRTDALMKTNGRLQNLAFAEIKHHKTPLLHADFYRSECWPASHELSGGVTQIQQTVHLAMLDIGERLPSVDADGVETGDVAYLVRPRSYLVVGNLGQLLGPDGGLHAAKHRSFELYRRNLVEPDVITFDELLARAEWNVALAEGQTG